MGGWEEEDRWLMGGFNIEKRKIEFMGLKSFFFSPLTIMIQGDSTLLGSRCVMYLKG